MKKLKLKIKTKKNENNVTNTHQFDTFGGRSTVKIFNFIRLEEDQQ